jgi:hypothetical protein
MNYYYITYEGYPVKDLHRYTFYIESTGKNGWALLRMCAIEDTDKDGNFKNYVEYNPVIHNGRSHYMSIPYRARKCWDWDQEQYTYKIFNGEGNILTGNKLIVSDIIQRIAYVSDANIVN